MITSKRSLLIYLLYIVVTSIVFLTTNRYLIENKNIKFFFQDTDIKYKIDIALALDPNTGTVIISRMFHNKVSLSLDTFTKSIYQSLDPVFLFSLSDKAPLYTDPNNLRMLFPFEFPFFIASIIYILGNWKFKRDKYFYLMLIFFLSILLIGLLLPRLHPLKLLPLVIVLRTTIFLGLSDWLSNQKWAKKYFS